MMIIPCFLSVLVILQTTTVSAASCPCFSGSDVRGEYHEFASGEFIEFPQGNFTTHKLTHNNGKRYSILETNFNCAQVHACEVVEDFATGEVCPLGPNHQDCRLIDRQELFACLDLILYTTPSSAEELAIFDSRINEAAVSLRNVGTGNYLTVASEGSIVTENVPSSLAHQWAFLQDECPAIGSSAAKYTKYATRTCFRLASLMDPETTILGTNGGNAFPHHPPANILSVYILEPIRCYRTMRFCTLKLQVAFYGDRSVADIPVGDRFTTLELAVGGDQDLAVAEWVFDMV